MNKFIKFTVAGIFALVIILFLTLMFRVNSIVKTSIEEIGTEMTGTAVTTDRVSISPFSGQGLIRGFKVANPEDYSRDYAVEMDDFYIDLDFFSLFSDEIKVDEIIITSPSLFVEQKLPANNINTILRNIQSVDAGETSEAELIIERFYLQDASVDLYTEIGGEREARFEISSIELRNPGGIDGRFAVEEVIKQIAGQIAREALRDAAQHGGQQLRDAIEDLFD